MAQIPSASRPSAAASSSSSSASKPPAAAPSPAPHGSPENFKTDKNVAALHAHGKAAAAIPLFEK